jgi:cytochrome P450 monooxygenase
VDHGHCRAWRPLARAILPLALGLQLELVAQAVYKVHDFVNVHIRSRYAQIEERKRRIREGKEVGPERTDLLWFMASNVPEEEELRSQLCLVLVSNNHITYIFISNCLRHLARHPEAWTKL